MRTASPRLRSGWKKERHPSSKATINKKAASPTSGETALKLAVKERPDGSPRKDRLRNIQLLDQQHLAGDHIVGSVLSESFQPVDIQT